jgi:hypothetical protein
MVQKPVNHRDKPGGEKKFAGFDGRKRPSYGRSLVSRPLISSSVAGQSRRGAVTIVALVVLMILAGLSCPAGQSSLERSSAFTSAGAAFANREAGRSGD